VKDVYQAPFFFFCPFVSILGAMAIAINSWQRSLQAYGMKTYTDNQSKQKKSAQGKA